MRQIQSFLARRGIFELVTSQVEAKGGGGGTKQVNHISVETCTSQLSFRGGCFSSQTGGTDTMHYIEKQGKNR